MEALPRNEEVVNESIGLLRVPVYLIGHGVILFASVLAGGPRCLATCLSLEGRFFNPIEEFSNTLARYLERRRALIAQRERLARERRLEVECFVDPRGLFA